MKFPPEGNRDTTEKVLCSPSKIIDPSQPKLMFVWPTSIVLCVEFQEYSQDGKRDTAMEVVFSSREITLVIDRS